MIFKIFPEKFWDLIATRYAASSIADMVAYKVKIEKIKSYLSSDDIVMDIGCGTGTQCMDLSGDVKQIIGIDISGKLLAIADERKTARKIENVVFIKTLLFDERFQPGSFDVIMAFYVLHFFEDIDTVFQRIHDLLKPEGIIICETACMGEKNKITGGLLRLAGNLGFLPKINLLTTRQLEQALERAGFSLSDKTRFSELNKEFTLIAKKQ